MYDLVKNLFPTSLISSQELNRTKKELTVNLISPEYSSAYGYFQWEIDDNGVEKRVLKRGKEKIQVFEETWVIPVSVGKGGRLYQSTDGRIPIKSSFAYLGDLNNGSLNTLKDCPRARKALLEELKSF